MSKEEIKTAIRKCAKKIGHAPSLNELNRASGITQRDVIRNFGTYTLALGECGMERKGCGHKAPLDALFRDWAGIVRKLGKLPSVAEYHLHSEYSIQPLFTRFGSWKQTPLGLMLYAQEHDLGEEWKDVLDKVREHGRTEAMRGGRGRHWDAAGAMEVMEALKAMHEANSRVGSVAGMGPAVADWANAMRKDAGEKKWPKILPDRPTYGPSLVQSALAHGPTNELGVLYLFGMLAARLGFVVLRIQAEFPDCEAMRQVGEELWQKVRIEFEFESRNFVKHLHEPDGCDLIVCWRHNWPECPLEVVELKGALSNQRSAFSPEAF